MAGDLEGAAGAADRLCDVHGKSLADSLGDHLESEEGRLRRMLPSPDATASDLFGRDAPVNAGSARESFAPIGSNLPD